MQLKKEKPGLITTHLRETRTEALRTKSVAVSDDDDDDDDDEGDDTVLRETRSEGSEGD